jgi:lysophospholipase L1-like esterase
MKKFPNSIALGVALMMGQSLAVAQTSAIAAPDAASVAKASIPQGTRTSDSTKPARHIDALADWVSRRYLAIDEDLASDVSLDKVKILFVGDSITQFYKGDDDATQAAEWRSAYTDEASPNYALNLGVAGDRTENVLLRLLSKQDGGFGHLDDPRIQPQIIVLMIGINNTWSSRSDIVRSTSEGQIAVIRRLLALRPNATIIVNSVLPTNNRTHNRSLVEPINRRLAEATGRMSPSVVWLDLYSAFLSPDGTSDPALFKDGVHPNAAGYTRWTTALHAKLDEVRVARPSSQSKP